MSTKRVALAKQGERSIVVDDGATAGATFGVDLRWPDGRMVAASDFGVAPPSEPGLSVTYWRMLREVPPNVVALANTITTGLYVIAGAGESATRAIEAVDGETTVANGDGVDANPAIGLADVDAVVGGSLQLTQFDSKGRRSHEGDATTDDLEEGDDNLYYTDGRADARIALQKGQPLGLATLDADAKLEANQLPALAITDTFVVNTEAAMLALDAQQGDVAVRTDLQKSYILTADPASTLANWQELLTPTGTSGTVTSVGLSVPAGFAASGSPITVSGTLSMSYDTGYQGYTSVEATKLSGIAAGATVGATWGTNLGSIPANITSWAGIDPASKANDADVVKLTGAQLVGGRKTFTSASIDIAAATGNAHIWFQDTSAGTTNRALIYWNRAAEGLYFRTYDATGAAVSSEVIIGPSTFTYGGSTIWHAGNMPLASGTYTPVATGVANVASHIAFPHSWMRVGNSVTISGRIDVLPTAGTTFTQIRVALPVASSFTAGSDLSGAGSYNISSTSIEPAFVAADAASDQIIISFICGAVSNHGLRYSATYPILP